MDLVHTMSVKPSAMLLVLIRLGKQDGAFANGKEHLVVQTLWKACNTFQSYFSDMHRSITTRTSFQTPNFLSSAHTAPKTWLQCWPGC